MRCERYGGAGGWSSLPGGKAAEGGVMKCERYAGGSPCGWWLVPTFRLFDFSTCWEVGKLAGWCGRV